MEFGLFTEFASPPGVSDAAAFDASLGQMRAAARELPPCLVVGAAAPLEHDVPSAVHDVPPGNREAPSPGASPGRHQDKPALWP